MKKLSTLAGLLVPVAASAQDVTPPAVAVAVAPPLVLTLLIFGSACACVFVCIQVFGLLRGGQLSKSWLVFTGAFLLLALTQLIMLLNGFGVLEYSRYLVPLLSAAMAGLFFYGLYETKRRLS